MRANAPQRRWWRARTRPWRSVKSRKRWQASGKPITLSPFSPAFEQSVAKEEATAKAFDQLASAGKDGNLEAEFAQLEGHTVDAELDALKRERRPMIIRIAQRIASSREEVTDVFEHKAPPSRPGEDLAHLTITDARVGDALSVLGAGPEFRGH